jgi:hypothetical protein
LRHDPVIGQCVSYYKLFVDFRHDQGPAPEKTPKFNKQKLPSV